MKYSLIILTLLLCFLLLGFIYPSGVNPGNENPCLECHVDILEQNFKHAPVEEGCGKCHNSTGKAHPGNNKGFELKEKMPQLCIGCHDVISNKKMVHSPVGNGNCTGCHSPHSSAYKKLLIADKKKICLGCHNKSLSKDNKKIINMAELIQTRKYVHEALNGGCTPCHSPHASDYPELLIAAFPAGHYSPAVKDSFDLCFQCHDSDLLEKELTTTATNFRNGEKNLHFKHMNGSKARSCINCHDVHGSDNLHLIADKIPFGKWEIPIIYKPSENGGMCNTGCHAERSYTR